MKEIKFRAWNPNRERMSDTYNIFEMTTCEGDVSRYAEDTIFMQYTGLKDKNAKDVYEGDIIKNEDDIAEVRA